MTKLEKIEREIKSLNEAEFKALAAWMDEERARLWDDQIERDAKAGKLDRLAEEVLADRASGRVRPL